MQPPRLQPLAAVTPSGTAAARAAVHAVAGAYFAALDIPLAAGRLFDGTDALVSGRRFLASLFAAFAAVAALLALIGVYGVT